MIKSLTISNPCDTIITGSITPSRCGSRRYPGAFLIQTLSQKKPFAKRWYIPVSHLFRKRRLLRKIPPQGGNSARPLFYLGPLRGLLPSGRCCLSSSIVPSGLVLPAHPGRRAPALLGRTGLAGCTMRSRRADLPQLPGLAALPQAGAALFACWLPPVVCWLVPGFLACSPPARRLPAAFRWRPGGGPGRCCAAGLPKKVNKPPTA